MYMQDTSQVGSKTNFITNTKENIIPHLKHLSQLVGANHAYYDAQTLDEYSHDWTEDLHFPPDLVLKPESTQQVSAILAYCNDHEIPVTPSGGRTGLSGGMLPVHGGVLLSMERMNRILEVDTRNLQMVVEAGVIVQHIHEAAEAVGLMYPPDPSSRGSCMIGGNVAENAGGIRAVKYGITQEYVLALEAVLPNGEIINTGARVLKNATGYNLTQLLVGSEGTLAVVTRIVLKLVPKPAHEISLFAAFPSAEHACEAVAAVFHAGITPSALEFMEKDAIDYAAKYLGITDIDTEGSEAHLLVALDGQHLDSLWSSLEVVNGILERHGAGAVTVAETAEQKDKLWKMRRIIGEAVKGTSIYKEEDTVVPRAELPSLLRTIKVLGTKHGFRSVCYGHAGDGNLHVNILKGEMTDEQWNVEVPKAIEELFRFVVSKGGTLSGEHGIGWVQKRYMHLAFSETELMLMKQLKNVFDPKGILNPGKLFD